MSELEIIEIQKWLQPPMPHQEHRQEQVQQQQTQQKQGIANLQARRQSTDL